MCGPAGSCDRSSQEIKLNDGDRKELLELYRQAQSTPVITTGIGRPSMAASAWDDVRKKMDDLGEKYGFDPNKIKGINPETGEIKT